MQLRNKKIMGIMGAGEAAAPDHNLAYECGRAVAGAGYITLCGGMGGLMQHCARGAKEAGGITLGILPGRNTEESPPNAFIDIPIFTGLNDARNYVNVCTSHAIIALPGSAGTLSEIALALKLGKKVAALGHWQGLDTMLKPGQREGLRWFAGSDDIPGLLQWLSAGL